MPTGYDARTREWYTSAATSRQLAWRLLVDASTKRLTATVSMPITAADGRLLGVAGIDAPLESMLPESDLSKRWGDGVSTLIVAAEDTPGGETRLMVHGDREFLGQDHGWDTTLAPHPLATDDPRALATLITAVKGNHSILVSLDVGSVPSLAAYKPFPSGSAGLLVVVPRQSVLHQADTAEMAILDRTQLTLYVVAGFTLTAITAAVLMDPGLVPGQSTGKKPVGAGFRPVASGRRGLGRRIVGLLSASGGTLEGNSPDIHHVC